MRRDAVVLISLTSLVMVAFASNSVLNRLAVEGMFIDPGSFALIRVVSGAIALGMILIVRGGGLPVQLRPRLLGSLSLSLYLVGFSLAYLTLDAGLGALILFGTVQLSMFAHAARRDGGLSRRRTIGAAIAFVGLIFALWPGGGSPTDPVGALLMVAAGIGWAIYSIAGRKESDALGATAANFMIATPLLAVLFLNGGTEVTFAGAGLSIACGAVTSGLGYALWYTVLPRLETSTAAVVQLSVPVIAILGGAVFLGEALSIRIGLSAVIVLGGIAIAIISLAAPKGHKVAHVRDQTPED
ncbi:MAG: DMT family transporter [Paracoccaceae bacterium]